MEIINLIHFASPHQNLNTSVTRWFAGLRPASLLGLRLPNKLGVFPSDTVSNLKFPGTKGTFRYNIVRKNKVDTKIEDISCTKNKVDKNVRTFCDSQMG